MKPIQFDMKNNETNKENIAAAHDAGPQRNEATRTSKRQALKSFASKLRRTASKRDSQADRSHHNRRKSQLFDIPSVVVEAEPEVLANWGTKKSQEVPRPSKDSVAGQYYVAKPSSSKASHKPSKSSAKQLTQEDLAKLFAGAPEFEIKAGKPRVSYQWKLDEESGQPRDFVEASHGTFAAATLGRHSGSKQLRELLEDDADMQTPKIVDEGLVEIPNMMSLNGSEPGTVGMEYFLQIPVSDSKRVGEDNENDIRSKRQMLATSPEKLGLKPLDLENLIDRLSELSDARQSRVSEENDSREPNEQKATELHAELFSKLLSHPQTDGVADDPSTGLDGQIIALARVLDTSGLWYDFSLVENRIRLGQFLWPSIEDDESILDEEQTILSERDIVLLQITLACELLVRVELSNSPVSSLSRKMRWDLVLAQRFLDNIRIAPKLSSGDDKPYRNSIMSIATFVTARESPDENRVEPILYPRHERRQIEGLMAFAEALAWPHEEEIRERFAERVRRHSRDVGRFSVYGAPLGTPNQATGQSNYFGQQKRPQVGRSGTAQSLQLLPASAYGSETFDLGGWLSRSWLTGFILPGETTSHLLISALLENSPAAVAALGDAANLYQGFVYKSRSYWSKSCVVGRVIAAANGATDCMGWVSCSSAPADQQDGWVNLEVKDLPSTTPTRIADGAALASDSAFVRGGKTTVTNVEFSWPSDGLTVLGNEARYHGFSLLPTGTNFELTSAGPDTETGDTQLAAIATAIACLEFSPKRSSRPTKVTLPLLYDVHFISSTPCFPSSSRPPSSTSSSPPRSHCSNKELPSPPTHPLHSSHTLNIIPAASILADDFTDTVHLGDETVVLDCRGTGELQLLARAWCAKVGENAIVGRAGRTCMACCAREAAGLGIKVVIRV